MNAFELCLNTHSKFYTKVSASPEPRGLSSTIILTEIINYFISWFITRIKLYFIQLRVNVFDIISSKQKIIMYSLKYTVVIVICYSKNLDDTKSTVLFYPLT